MQLVQSFLTKNPCYTGGKTIKPQGIMLHSVGCPQPKASVFISNWNKASYNRACVHGFIDALTGTVYQTLPWNRRGWHSASGKNGSANNTHIGIEMCEPDCIKYVSGATFTCSNKQRAVEMAERTYKSAVELFAMLCKEFNFDPLADGVIISHSEGSYRGIASAHGDPDHLWKQLGMSNTMDGFRKDVKAAMGSVSANTSSTTETSGITNLSGTVQVTYQGGVNLRTGASMSSSVSQTVKSGTYTVTGISADKSWYRLSNGLYITTRTDLVKFTETPTQASTSVPFKVYVSITNLVIRSGPGTSYRSTGKFTGKGTFTITEEKDGWGKLKSGAGWISLSYCKKL